MRGSVIRGNRVLLYLDGVGIYEWDTWNTSRRPGTPGEGSRRDSWTALRPRDERGMVGKIVVIQQVYAFFVKRKTKRYPRSCHNNRLNLNSWNVQTWEVIFQSKKAPKQRLVAVSGYLVLINMVPIFNLQHRDSHGEWVSVCAWASQPVGAWLVWSM